MTFRRTFGFVVAASLATLVLLACSGNGGAAGTSSPAQTTAGGSNSPQAATIQRIARAAMDKYHLRAIVVRVTEDGVNVYTGAMGLSMNGVPATPQMHFRNGAMAFTYTSLLLLELVDQKKVALDDKLSKFYPNYRDADKITLKNLANMTSGYADYVYTPELINGITLNPFRHWSSQELINIGLSKPMMFAPGTNFGYSHTNYVILGGVIEKITGMPLAKAMQQYIFGPLGLKQTQSIDTPWMPEPVLHTFSSERRSTLGIKTGVPFYEESTFWDPSWTTANGAVQVTDITDFASSMEAVGTGKLLSKESFQAQVGPNLAGFGHKDPKCPICLPNSKTGFNYGLGVVNIGPWITQTKSFSGCSGTVGYLPSKKLTIAVVVTYAPAAFDAEGNYKTGSVPTFSTVAEALAPHTVRPMPQ